MPVCAIRPALRAVYDSEGVLHSLHRNVAPQSSYVFHFAGRPIAQLDISGGSESWKWLTADHLGTPIAATGTGGALLWQGGFEPFGADWSGADGAGVFLRFPGQWEEGVWGDASLGTGLYYNVHRWYGANSGRYFAPDPMMVSHAWRSTYLYAEGQATALIDPLGLYSVTSHSSEEFATGDPKFRGKDVRAEFTCGCCSPGGKDWCLKFRVHIYYGFYFPRPPLQCERAHEQVHLRIFKNFINEVAIDTILPPERKRYGSRDQCEDAGRRAKDLLFSEFKRRDHIYSQRQRSYDRRVWVPEFFTCGITGK